MSQNASVEKQWETVEFATCKRCCELVAQFRSYSVELDRGVLTDADAQQTAKKRRDWALEIFENHLKSCHSWLSSGFGR